LLFEKISRKITGEDRDSFSILISRENNINSNNQLITMHELYLSYGQSLATNALKRLLDQLEERILQTDQLKKRLQHRR